MDPLKQKIKETQLFTPQEKIDILASIDTIGDEDQKKLTAIIDEYDAKHKTITQTFKTNVLGELDGIVKDAKPEDKDRIAASAEKIKSGLASIASAGIPIPFKGGEECAARSDTSLLVSRRHLLS